MKWLLLLFFCISPIWAGKNSDAEIISAIAKARKALSSKEMQEAQQLLNEAEIIPTKSYKVRWQLLETQILALYMSNNYSRAEQILSRTLPKPSNVAELYQAFSSLALLQAALLNGKYFLSSRILLSQFRGWYAEFKKKVKGPEVTCALEAAALTQAVFEKLPAPDLKADACKGAKKAQKGYFEYLQAAQKCDRFKMAEKKFEFLPEPEVLDFRHSFTISVDKTCENWPL